jgi:hypothetical protein
MESSKKFGVEELADLVDSASAYAVQALMRQAEDLGTEWSRDLDEVTNIAATAVGETFGEQNEKAVRAIMGLRGSNGEHGDYANMTVHAVDGDLKAALDKRLGAVDGAPPARPDSCGDERHC